MNDCNLEKKRNGANVLQLFLLKFNYYFSFLEKSVGVFIFVLEMYVVYAKWHLGVKGLQFRTKRNVWNVSHALKYETIVSDVG